MKIVSRTISIVFNPLLIVSQLFWLLLIFYPEIYSLNYAANRDWILIHGGLLAFGTSAMPLISLLFLKQLGYISNFKIDSSKNWTLPFFFVAFWYAFSTYLFASKLAIEYHFMVILSVSTILIALLAISNRRYKISPYSTAICGAAGFITAIALRSNHFPVVWLLTLTFIAAGAVGTARLYMNASSFNQVLYGSLAGFILCFSSLYLFW